MEQCVTCGAQARIGFDTCDTLCGRAQLYGRTRGRQTEVEARNFNHRPIDVDCLTSVFGAKNKAEVRAIEDRRDYYRTYED